MSPAAPNPHLSIVLPAYNEEGNVENAIRRAFAAARPLVPSVEVVMVDDGSRDGTAAVLSRLVAELGPELRVVTHPVNKGYGTALRNGFAASLGELVFYTDSDNQFDLRQLDRALPLMADHDAVLGFRENRREGPHRKLVSGLFNAITRLAFGMSVRDMNCSFKLFRGDRLRALPLQTTDFTIDAEIVARVHRDGWHITQVGVTHLPREAGESTVGPLDVPRTLLSMARVWWAFRQEPATAPSSAAADASLP